MKRLEEIVVRAAIVKTESGDAAEETETQITTDDLDTDIGEEGLGKLWKKFKMWLTESNRSAVDNVNEHFKFINEETDEKSLAEILSTVKHFAPHKKDLLLMNKVALHVIDIYGKEFSRIKKTGSFLNAFKHSEDKGLNIPECTQLVAIWKTIGVSVSFDYESNYVANLDYREYNKRYTGLPDRSLVKMGFTSIKDLADMVDVVNNTMKFMIHFYTNVNKQMVDMKGFPMAPKGLTMTKAENSLANMNLLRTFAIRNGCVHGFDIANSVLTITNSIMTKVKSKA